MNEKLFSEAMGEIDSRYLLEALAYRRPVRRFHRLAVGLAAVLVLAVLSFGTMFAANAAFRQAVISFLFPLYTEEQLHEIDEGHRTGSFDMEDTLFTFLEKFGQDQLAEGVTLQRENGFICEFLPISEDMVHVIVSCTAPDSKLLVILERIPYQETTGLWQVTAYQVIDSKTAAQMTGNKQ